MADAPRISSTGNATSRQAASVAQRVQTAMLPALQQLKGPLQIDRLHIQLPVGASDAEFAKAVTRAIAARQRQR